ncbi:Conserved hypothetical protein [Vibrio nigripulchritudo SFn27]|uniref:Type VI secretion system (T6SS), amidase effector protein 4 n=1 Tax=Vibrio nigripulchritudo TaxID=28173 RepID=U4K564_9VIBR|nr:type VI secretion system amidase effector protein Tae4 [Vibrio nigripulchritudo]CCN80767.1 Conserved hypothetical protein [Vibrio nigripulchritudo BLFn1]CCN88167.1 Conserved hypothetical protein [Vibrio nigripulchritudo SFn27]CCN93672.1 Conserved hypothetical protein [Vibrio nigripulchritudo ENn2]CCO43545.1 Conserved hypothetical protein [Vibrio nigripulchritudo SFn135]CCO53360.1 Conserved hypothetical protein [Vibrio nigripulchritudo Wn13]
MSKFKELWDKFPDGDIMRGRCQNKQPNGTRPFDNYCAILLSEAFIRTGISTKSAKVTKCWSHSGSKHIIRAQEMAHWLNKSNLSFVGKREKINPSTFSDDLKGRTGIIFFKDYWQRGSEAFSNRSGDHIDLWNKDEITSGGMFRRSLYEFFGVVSDFNDSREVWFWEVK